MRQCWKHDLLGRRFGNWTVVNGPVKRRGKISWECRCLCGKMKFVNSQGLVGGRSRSCGCGRRRDPETVGANCIFSIYRSNAKARGHAFEISREDFVRKLKENCHYCGIEPQQVHKSRLGFTFTYNGIDRLDSDKGYSADNIVPCCSQCNFAKHCMNYELFKKWVKRVYLHLFRKITDKTPGELIDALITTNIKCFMFQEKLFDKSISDEDYRKHTDTVLAMNKKRNHLMRTIDTLLDFSEDMVTPKTFLPGEKEDTKPEF